jgi:hypothetical protein
VVTTHLIFFGFFTGAEPTAAGSGYGTSQPPIGFFALNDGATPSDVEPTPEPSPSLSGGGGSGKRYPVGNLDLDTWRRKGKRLKARVEAVQKKIQAKREAIEEVSDYSKIKALKKQIAELQRTLVALLIELDMARKGQREAEDEDAMMAYLAYKRLH